MTEAAAPKPPSPALSLAIDYLPLILFFATFKLAGVFTGTLVFMVAIVAAVWWQVPSDVWLMGLTSKRTLPQSAVPVSRCGGTPATTRSPL